MGLANWNKAVQESKLFGSVKEIFLENGLAGKARGEALDTMERKASDKYVANAKEIATDSKFSSKDLAKRRGDFINQGVLNADPARANVSEGASAWKDMSVGDQARMRGLAASSASLKHPVKLGNADTDLKQYNAAMRAAKRSAKARSAGGIAKGYYADPIKDGRYGTAAARIGATAVGVGTVGAITYSLTSDGPDYSSNYASSSGNTTAF